MSRHCNTIHTHPVRAQRSYVVKIDAGAFANVEIVVVGSSSSNYHREDLRAPSRTVTASATSKHHGYAYVPVPSTTPTANRPPYSPLQTSPDARSKRPYEREHVAAAQQRRASSEEKRAREEIRRRREEARLDEARRAATAAAAAEEAARQRRRRYAEQERQMRQQQEQQEQERQQRALREERRRRRRRLERTPRARDREIASAWRSYEDRWGLLSQRQPELGLGLFSALTFERIPWPVAEEVQLDRTLDALRPEAIREFLLSPAHSPDVSPKDRIRAALRRWHPDKFVRVLTQVIESDRDAVEDGMGIVVRCLNDMLERESHA